jgi:RNA polymerase sigma-70 factor (ECF subfamily)
MLLERLPSAGCPPDTLEAALGALVTQARAAHPGIDVGAADFVAHVASRLPHGRPALEALAELRIDDLYLACACALGHHDAITRAVTLHFDRAEGALARIRGENALAEDALQRVREALFVGTEKRPPKIAEYGGRGELSKWIRTIAMRMAMDMLAPSKEVAVSNEKIVSFQLPTDDPQLELMKREYGASFKRALADAVTKLPDDLRRELGSYYLDGRGLEEMAAEQGVVPSTISRRLAKARQVLWEETRKTLLSQLRVSDDDLDSILRMLETRLELSRSALVVDPKKSSSP